MTFTISGDVATLLGADHTTGDPVALWVECSQPVMVVGATGLLGGRLRATVASNGTFSVAGLPASVGDLPLYRLVVDSRSLRLAGNPRGLTTNWFPLTANRDLTWIVANYVTVTVITAATATNVAAAAALGATNDTATASYVNNPASATDIALTAKYARRADRPISAKAHGVVANGTTDDGPALAAAITAAGAGGTVLLPPGNVKVTTPVQITGSVTLQGGGSYTTRIYAVGCNGVEVAAGVTDFRMIGIEVAAATRHTTTPNTLVGIKVDGTTGSRPANHLYRDVYVDGFWTGLQTRYLWSSVFENVRTGFGRIGLHAYGKSVNNFVHAGSFMVAAETGSKGIALFGRESPTDSTEVATEGWVISDTLTNGAEVGIDMISCNHVSIHDCILDFNMLYAIRVQNGPTVFGTNFTIHDNYMAMTGATGAAAILLSNTISDTQKRYTRVHHNEILAYAGATCTYGIAATGTQAQAVIDGNTLRNFGTHDIYVTHAGTVVRHNACLSTVTDNIRATAACEVGGNVGTVNRTGVTTTSNYARDPLGKRVVSGPAAPASGAWLLGERVVNDVPTVGQPKAWVCTVAGSPGTWVSEGNL